MPQVMGRIRLLRFRILQTHIAAVATDSPKRPTYPLAARCVQAEISRRVPFPRSYGRKRVIIDDADCAPKAFVPYRPGRHQEQNR